ncbi:MAG: hypothetical protein K0S09_1143 [Sphingobacteriaceae bacterium]|jgi:hypothetical protein|nr:hypothetical protein [Sphingobacteriaceae bacterium]
MTALKVLVTVTLITFHLSTFGQQYLRRNEKLIYSFTTTNNKKVVLAKDINDGYIVYRFGTSDKIELEYPQTNKTSWKLFNYSHWLRGGGVMNEGMDLNYVHFIKGNYKYVIYDTYFALGSKSSIGIYVINLTTNKRVDIQGVKKTRKGTLTVLRDNKFIVQGEELFD